MLIGPGHEDWTDLIVALYMDHPVTLMRYETIERQRFIMVESGRNDVWFTEEAVQFYRHYGGDHAPDNCSHCNAPYC
jgi:hypothetical protein